MTTAQAIIAAGICGFKTTVTAQSEDQQAVTFRIESDCAKIRALAGAVARLGSVDAYNEIDPRGKALLMPAMSGALTGCCSGCVVPVGVYKSMQVVASLALPGEVRIDLSGPRSS